MCEWYKYMVTMVAQVTLVVADPKKTYCKHITKLGLQGVAPPRGGTRSKSRVAVAVPAVAPRGGGLGRPRPSPTPSPTTNTRVG